MDSPRLVDFAICRVFNGGRLVSELRLVQDDDARLSDARTPLAHVHAIGEVTGLSAELADLQTQIDGVSGGGVAETRLISTSAPLTGGGDLSADRTIGWDTTAALDNVARVNVRKNSAGSVFGRRRINFIEGSNVTLTITDDAGNEEVDVQVAAASGSAATWTEVEIDFGSTPAYDAQFTVVDAAVTGASKIIILPTGKAATGRTADDWQWDGLTLAATPASGSFTLYALAHPGPVVGKRKVQYSVAA